MAISIPIFTAQLEKSREATDEGNTRSLYAEVTAAVLAEDTSASTTIKDATLSVTKDANGVCTGVGTIKLAQQKTGLEGGASAVNIGGVDVSGWAPGKTATITIKSDGTAPTITIG